MNKTYSNIFYFKKISKIGGTEQFLYEIAKEYNQYDITIMYDIADENQLKRLRKLVRCKQHIDGEKVYCKRAFFNFNINAINDIESTENYYCFVSHANYDELHRTKGGYIPPINHPKINHYIGVSEFATKKLDEFAKDYLGKTIKTKRCYNPLTLEPKEKVMHLVSAGRLDDKVKGAERTLKLIEALDRYCEKTGRHYIWTIFTNPTNNINSLSENICIMKPRIDVRPYIADADYVLQLSNDMETYCYTINEALGYGVPIVTTPLSILNELPITDNEHIVLDWDCENVDEVAKQIFEKKVKPFEYNIPEDSWKDFIVLDKSSYKEEKQMKYLIEATDLYIRKNVWDVELSQKKSEEEGKEVKYYPRQGEQWEVDFERKELLVEKKYAKLIKEIPDKKEKKEEVKKEAKKTSKTTKTRKTKKESK